MCLSIRTHCAASSCIKLNKNLRIALFTASTRWTGITSFILNTLYTVSRVVGTSDLLTERRARHKIFSNHFEKRSSTIALVYGARYYISHKYTCFRAITEPACQNITSAQTVRSSSGHLKNLTNQKGLFHTDTCFRYVWSLVDSFLLLLGLIHKTGFYQWLFNEWLIFCFRSNVIETITRIVTIVTIKHYNQTCEIRSSRFIPSTSISTDYSSNKHTNNNPPREIWTRTLFHTVDNTA